MCEFVVNTDMFGQYVRIPTGYSGEPHIYKVVSLFQSNTYCDVPIVAASAPVTHKKEFTGLDSLEHVLNVIHCGIDESKVIRVALKDCEIVEMQTSASEELQQYRAIGTVEDCREAVEKQKPKKSERGLGEDVRCPICGTWTTAIYEHRYCSYCGQRLE